MLLPIKATSYAWRVISLPFTFLAHFFEALSVGSADEVRLHVINAALRVHQVLIVLSFDLDHAHYNAVNHVHRLSLIVFSSLALLTAILRLLAIKLLTHVVDSLASILINSIFLTDLVVLTKLVLRFKINFLVHVVIIAFDILSLHQMGLMGLLLLQ